MKHQQTKMAAINDHWQKGDSIQDIPRHSIRPKHYTFSTLDNVTIDGLRRPKDMLAADIGCLPRSVHSLLAVTQAAVVSYQHNVTRSDLTDHYSVGTHRQNTGCDADAVDSYGCGIASQPSVSVIPANIFLLDRFTEPIIFGVR